MTTMVLLPRDGMFLKDGREWSGADAGRAHSLDWPMPSTILGALRTAYGRMQESNAGRPHRKHDWTTLELETALGRTLVMRRPITYPAAEFAHAHRVC